MELLRTSLPFFVGKELNSSQGRLSVLKPLGTNSKGRKSYLRGVHIFLSSKDIFGCKCNYIIYNDITTSVIGQRKLKHPDLARMPVFILPTSCISSLLKDFILFVQCVPSLLELQCLVSRTIPILPSTNIKDNI